MIWQPYGEAASMMEIKYKKKVVTGSHYVILIQIFCLDLPFVHLIFD